MQDSESDTVVGDEAVLVRLSVRLRPIWLFGLVSRIRRSQSMLGVIRRLDTFSADPVFFLGL